MFFTKAVRKPFLAAMTAAVALSTMAATPARADDGDVVRFLAGATALAIIVNAANDHDRPRVVHRDRRAYWRHERREHWRHRWDRGHDRRTVVIVNRDRDHRRWHDDD